MAPSCPAPPPPAAAEEADEALSVGIEIPDPAEFDELEEFE